MSDRKIWFTAVNVVIYFVGAAIIFGWLAIRASNGGLFSVAAREFRTIVPSAPGVEPNKTEVLSHSGVPIGVVTEVEGVKDGAKVSVKLTHDLDLKADASARVVIRNIIGERAILIEPGSSDKLLAASAAQLPYANVGDIIEPSDALNPLKDIQGLSDNEEITKLVSEQQAVFAEAQDDVDVILADGQKLSGLLSTQQVALDNIGRRSSELVDVLAAKGTDINTMLAQTASLAKSAEGLLDDNLVVVQNGLDLAANTLTMVSRRKGELDYVLSRLPEVASDIEHASNTLIKLLNNEKGYYVYVAISNLPTIDQMIAALKGGV